MCAERCAPPPAATGRKEERRVQSRQCTHQSVCQCLKMKFLPVFVALLSSCQAGKLLFYMPLTSKSMKITYMPLAETMAERGHQVTVVMPHKHPSTDNLTIMTIESEFEAITEE